MSSSSLLLGPPAKLKELPDREPRRLLQAPETVAVTLASAKCFGGDRKLLRFSGEGLCFALNIPRDDRAPAFIAFLDSLLPKLGGIPNLIKDSRLPRAVMESCYGEADEFRSRLKDFDPRRRFRSELSERLCL